MLVPHDPRHVGHRPPCKEQAPPADRSPDGPGCAHSYDRAVGVDYAYFAAEDDESAVTASAQPGGPLGWPVVVGTRKVSLFRKESVMESHGPVVEGFGTRGYDPIVSIGRLEALLRGVSYESLTHDPRWGGVPAALDSAIGERAALITLTDSLRDALAEASVERLHEVAGPWSSTEELSQPGWEDVNMGDHVEFLSRLQQLAAVARAKAHRLYCYAEA